ncbi:MAG: 23S rRNA pseudouridylate synthase B, partial [Rhodocyclaceae bacterium]|nr:23S rRNA pseudouridylate synthase B [Rhodocyclaceae bacterium]
MKPKQPAGERLQKLLANAGLGSRRHLETLISEGRVKVNGAVAKLGDRATPDDRIEIGGRPVGGKRLASDQRFVIIYNKPEGELVTRNDPEGRKTV